MIEDIKKRLEKATKGEWKVERIDGEPDVIYLTIYSDSGENIVKSNDILNINQFNDVQFIAHSKSDIEWLIDTNNKLNRALQRSLDEIKMSTDKIFYEHVKRKTDELLK